MSEPEFPKKVYFRKIKHYDRLEDEHLEPGEVEQIAAVSSDYKIKRGGFGVEGFQPYVMVYETYTKQMDVIRKNAKTYNRDDTADMSIWKRKVTYGEWELIETIPGSETLPGWY